MQIELTEREIDHIRLAVADAVRHLRRQAADEYSTTATSLATWDTASRFDAILAKLNLAVGGSMAYAGRTPQQTSPEATGA